MNYKSEPMNSHIIKSEEKLSDIQARFTALYPFLKIEFFRKKHGKNQGSAFKDLLKIDPELKLNFNKNGVINISDDMSVGQLEEEFQKIFGISAQVFRKSGRTWLETSKTDDWSLRRQNDQGKELSFFL